MPDVVLSLPGTVITLTPWWLKRQASLRDNDPSEVIPTAEIFKGMKTSESEAITGELIIYIIWNIDMASGLCLDQAWARRSPWRVWTGLWTHVTVGEVLQRPGLVPWGGLSSSLMTEGDVG